MRVERKPLPWWTRLRDRLRGSVEQPVIASPSRAPLLEPALIVRERPEAVRDLAEFRRELTELKSLMSNVLTELKELRNRSEQSDQRTVHIHRVDHMEIEQMCHVIGRLAVDQLDGTLNVGFSRNLRVTPRLTGETDGKRTAPRRRPPNGKPT